MNFFKKFFILIVVIQLFLVSHVLGDDGSFLKAGYYNRSVQIKNPETSLLAETFLRNGVTVYDSYCSTTCFSFKTQEENDKFIVYIYYVSDYVGKFFYYKTGTSDETVKFTNDFVSWMFKNAWSK